MDQIAGWIAPAATMIAAMMTAANLGARFTGWGFVVFLVGSIAWSVVGISTGQQNLLLTNGFLCLVNLVGIWRWLGKQAKYVDGGEVAAKRSAASRVPTLFSGSALLGAKVTDRDGDAVGTIVDTMSACSGAALAYVVVSEGGVAGVGERLHAVDPARLIFTADGVRTDLTTNDLAALPVIPADEWPATLPK